MDERFVEPLLTPTEMNVWDKASAAMGLKTELLMENASREAFHVLTERFGDLRGLAALVLAGPGNNGGDAVALARHLHDAGATVLLLLARPVTAYSGAAGFHLRLARRAKVPWKPLRPDGRFGLPPDHPCREPDILVDGLLGTGLAGETRPDYAAWIKSANRLGRQAFVLALDIPSGLSGLTGRPQGATVLADATVTFQAAKLGLALPPAATFTGEVIVRPIGIPRTVRQAAPPAHFLLTDALGALLPPCEPHMHKGSAGSLLIVGGSRGLTGAPVLAALGALRAGAGLVTVACPGRLEPVLKAGHPDVMTLPLGSEDRWTPDVAHLLREHLPRFDAVVLGPGLGRDPQAGAFLEALCPLPRPAVWDADALFRLARRRELLGALGPGCLLTPHPGEMARLLDMTIPEVEADRLGAVRSLAGLCRGTAILKGPGTVITSGTEEPGRVYVTPFAEPNLAVGGSGDVLAGVLGTLLGQGISPLQAACLGVYWHGLAGRLLAGDFPHRGNLASEIADALPRARTEWNHVES